MGEEPGCVNVASNNMSDPIGSDAQTAGSGSDWAAQAETQSSDFTGDVEEPEETRAVESHLEIKQHKEAERRTSPVDILRRNFGAIRPPSVGKYNVGTSKVGSMLDQDKLAVIQVPPYISCFNVSEQRKVEGESRPNLDTARPHSVGKYNIETSKGLHKVGSMLDHEKLPVIQVPPYISCFNVSKQSKVEGDSRTHLETARPLSVGKYNIETSKSGSMLDHEKLAVIQVPPYNSCFNVSEQRKVEGDSRTNLETARPHSAGVESMIRENLQNRRSSSEPGDGERSISDGCHESSEGKIFKTSRPAFECQSNVEILENLELNQGTILVPSVPEGNWESHSRKHFVMDNNVETPSVESLETLDHIMLPNQRTQPSSFHDGNYFLTLAEWEDPEMSIFEGRTNSEQAYSVFDGNVEILDADKIDSDSMLETLDYRRLSGNRRTRMDPETSRTNSDIGSHLDTQEALNKVGSTLDNLDQRRLVGNQRTNCSRSFNYGTARNVNNFSTSLESRDPKLSVSEGNLKSILSKNSGTIRPPSVVGSNVETHKDLDTVKFMLDSLNHRGWAEKQRTFGFSFNDREETDSDFPDLSTSLELEDLQLSVLESNIKAIEENEICQSKEHVYCTVYCIANDNYRKPLEAAPPSDPESPPPPELPEVCSLVNLPNPNLDLEIGHYPEPYTLRDLVDPSMFSSVLNVDDLVLTCLVCLDVRAIRPLHCCKKAVCEDCLKSYIGSQVLSGRAYIRCPIPECSGYLEESVVMSHLASEDVAKYKYFLELSRVDSGTKACPQCSLFTSLKGQNPPASGKMEQKFKIQCSRCQLVWCFKCHAPWHEGLKCRDYRRGDKLLRHWASVMEHGQRNAQKCPRCKIHIQRTEGCDHMTCTQCNTNFCYRCGEKYRQLRFFGDHTSNLSVFGCKYRYLPEKPHLRRFIRGSVCVSKVLVAPVLIVLLVVIGALALVIGLVAFPIYYICKKRKKHSNGTGRWLC